MSSFFTKTAVFDMMRHLSAFYLKSILTYYLEGMLVYIAII
jgi:hypothetical protein